MERQATVLFPPLGRVSVLTLQKIATLQMYQHLSGMEGFLLQPRLAAQTIMAQQIDCIIMLRPAKTFTFSSDNA